MDETKPLTSPPPPGDLYPPQQPPPAYSPPGYQTGPTPPNSLNLGHVEGQDGEPKEYPGMLCPMLLSCWVFWCFNPIFGAAAFFVACVGGGSYSSGDAWRLRRISLALSLTGVVLSLIVLLIVIIVHLTVGLNMH